MFRSGLACQNYGMKSRAVRKRKMRGPLPYSAWLARTLRGIDYAVAAGRLAEGRAEGMRRAARNMAPERYAEMVRSQIAAAEVSLRLKPRERLTQLNTWVPCE